jgi:outer membrane protein OmpA-like peptidoglycan-associated protein
MATKEEIRKAAVEAVAQRIAAEHAAKKAPPPVVKPPAAPRREDERSGDGHLTITASAALLFGKQKDERAFGLDQELTFDQLVLGQSDNDGRDVDHGQVEFTINVTWQFPTMGERAGAATMGMGGKGLAHFAVPFSINSDKPEQPSIAWQSPRTIAMTSEGGGATLTVASPPGADTTTDGGAATLTPTVQFQEQVALADTTAGNTVGGSAGFPSITIPIPFIGGLKIDPSAQVTHDTGGGHQEQTQAAITDSFTRSFTARVVLPAGADASKAPPLVVLFAVDSDATAADEQVITDWWKGLDKKLRTAIERGKTPINLLAKASATGSLEHNRKLAHGRADKVKEILADLAGDHATFNVQVPGKADAKAKGEDQSERVVEVTVGADNRPPTD